MKGTSLEIIQKGEFSFDCTQSPDIKKQSTKLIRDLHRLKALSFSCGEFHTKLSLSPENLSLALAYFSLSALETHLVPIFILLGHTWSWSERKGTQKFVSRTQEIFTDFSCLSRADLLSSRHGRLREKSDLTFVHERKTISTSPRRSF